MFTKLLYVWLACPWKGYINVHHSSKVFSLIICLSNICWYYIKFSSLVIHSFLIFCNEKDAKYAFLLCAAGYWSLFPLLFHLDLLVLRYAMYLGYMTFMLTQIFRFYVKPFYLNSFETLYLIGLLTVLPIYEHIVAPLTGLNVRLPFLKLLLTSLYCCVGVCYVYIRYYIFVLRLQPNDIKIRPLKQKL